MDNYLKINDINELKSGDIISYITLKNNKIINNKNVEYLSTHLPYIYVKSKYQNNIINYPVNLNDIQEIFKEMPKIKNTRFKNFHILIKNKDGQEDYKIYKSFQDKFQRTNFMKTKKFNKIIQTHDFILNDDAQRKHLSTQQQF